MDYEKFIQIIYQDDSEILKSLEPLSAEQLVDLLIAIDILKRVSVEAMLIKALEGNADHN